MAGTMSRVPATRRISDEIAELRRGATSLSDMVFGFLDDGFAEDSQENTCSSGDGYDDGDEEENSCSVEESKLFWEEQEQLLQVIYYYLFSFPLNIIFSFEFFRKFSNLQLTK